MNHQLKLALAATFLDALAKLPKQIKEKTIRFMKKFCNNPTSSGINYETIRNASSPNMRSIRIDQDYRGIVYKPERGNVYLLLWVDKHDDAYAWATRARCEVNPEVGSLQLWFNDVTEEAFLNHNVQSVEVASYLLEHLADKALLKLGVPQELLAPIKQAQTLEELEKYAKNLPAEVYEALYWIASGDDYEDVYNSVILPSSEAIDTKDFERALNHANSKRTFFLVDNDRELDAILQAPLEKWRVFLHPTQRTLVERDWNGPVRVLGGAGTGKTVAAMHRAKWLAENCFLGERKKILFTTFTKNLALDIEQNLEKICSPEQINAIEVINLDSFVVNFLRSQKWDYKIHYYQNNDPYWEEAMQLAPSNLAYPPSFYREEWEEVILRQGITEKTEYLQAARAGRNTLLSRKNRIAVWTVFEEYRQLLAKHKLREKEDAFRDARKILESAPNLLPYESIIVDEAQDMGNEAFKLLHQIIAHCNQKNSLFITGDAHQRIYNYQTVLSRCGINIRGRGKKLKLNYRTTEQNRKWAVNILKNIDFDDLDGEKDDQKGYVSLLQGIEPEIKSFETIEQEVNAIKEIVCKLSEGDDEQSICLVVRTKNQVEMYTALLENLGIKTHIINERKKENLSERGVRVATMHRVKGLEFDYVIIAGVNDGVIYNTSQNYNDELDKIERSLLYVAITRAKKQVVITHHGRCSSILLS